MNEAGMAYLEWFYGNHVWKYLSYRGVRTLKLPLDMWNYQEIIFENDLHWVVETGTRHGGSALYFADLLSAGRREGLVVSIDVTHQDLSLVAAAHPGIRFLLGDSASGSIREQVAALVPQQRRGGLLLMLDSDHTASHVLRELETWVPWPAEWRWMAAGHASPWYPGFRVYRQQPDGDWNEALTRLRGDLAARAP